MARASEGNEQLLCSFCGKSQRQVKKLIAGPGVYICDECIDLCNEIIDEELTTAPSFELASSSHDDAAVPNLVASPTGAAPYTFANGADAVILRDAMGAIVDGVEWGSDRAEIAGTPATAPGSAESLRRTAATGSRSRGE